MKPKVLITMEGGLIQCISANVDADIVLLDYDLPVHGEPAFMGKYSPDEIVEDGKFYLTLQGELTPEEKRVQNELKRIHF